LSAQHLEHPPESEALFPQPPRAEAALRIAVRRISPAEGVRFEQEFREAWQEAVQTDSTLPMHMFLLKWSEWVALHRFPARSTRLHELEKVVGQAKTGDEARAAAAEIGRLLAAAGEEAAER
jgi:hypothetical protein